MTNESILRRFLDRVWNNKDVSELEDFITSNYTIYLDPSDEWEGKTLNYQQFIRRLDDSFIPFPDIHFHILTAVSDSNYVAVTWEMTATNSGPIGDIPPTGKSIKTQGITIYYFKDGRISGHSQIFNRELVAQQLGFI